ncbi:translation initiation factor eIF-2A [Microthyrium microscopicum]|uniref:Eukaryotic translation initiation factor 2A n=1 Tax=Microthyrium microscopicum TaxID=703497 RepID=A0A6A6TXC9_9PEZI|nr:translation initiation factor eIF-2A [Microthyrium microscopicum]
MAEPTQLAWRSQKTIGVLNAAPVYQDLPGFVKPEGNLRCCCYSPDGKFFAWASPEQVNVVDASVGHVITILPATNVYELGFSPYGTYIITWQRPAKDADGNAVKNLKVWRTVDDAASEGGERSVVGQFVQRNQTGWNLQYTADEKFCARVVTNEVQFYESGNLRQVWNKLILEGVTDFSVSPGANHSVAVFVPERKGQPAAVKLYTVPNFDSPVCQKTFFKGDKVQMSWNENGTGCLILAQTDVDKTNKNYYGESTMFLLTTTGFDSRITLDKEGPIHDVAWSPNSREFGVTYGYMPAKTTIFNAKAQATHNFALGPRNTISFSPHGRFVLVAGFGNLAGQVDLYDLTKNYTKVCTIEASNASVCNWSPDGTHILFATTSPRLRVDNGIRVFHIGGGLMYTQEMEELYHVCWRPQSTTMQPLPKDPLSFVPEPHASAKAVLAKAKPVAKSVGAYRPPGARGTSTPLHFKREDEGGAAYQPNTLSSAFGGANGFGKSRRREVPGAELAEQPQGNGTDNNADNIPKGPKKRNKRGPKVKDGNNESNQPRENNHHRNNSRQYIPPPGPDGGVPIDAGNVPVAVAHSQPPQQSQPPQAPAISQAQAQANANTEKKTRSLLKKLRAIEDLKMRQASGEKLEATQVQKIQSEQQVKKELDAMGLGDLR